jgi:hypothetical protein
MKANSPVLQRLGLLFLLVLCFPACAPTTNHKIQGDRLSPEEFKAVQKRVDDRNAEIEGLVDKAHRNELKKTKKDLAEINKVASVMIQATDQFKRTKGLEIHCLKSMVQPWDDNPKRGFYFLMVDPGSKKGFFGVFYEGVSKKLTIETFGMTISMLGFLKIEGNSAVCDDCEGGNWSVPFIQVMATSLLPLKPVKYPAVGI